MNPEDLRRYEQVLIRWKEELLEHAAASIGEEIGVQEEQLGDAADLASLEADRNFTLRLRDRERKLIAKIDDTLVRIRAGTYGECDTCGESISLKRLDARPVATLCIRCKEEQEREER